MVTRFKFQSAKSARAALGQLTQICRIFLPTDTQLQANPTSPEKEM